LLLLHVAWVMTLLQQTETGNYNSNVNQQLQLQFHTQQQSLATKQVHGMLHV
jgi:hypothetical protein